MFFALSEVLGKAEIWFIFIAIFWAIFILCIDCWLVSTTAGSRWRTRVSILLPRLAIAAVFGIVIAEPLVLRVFETGITSHVREDRQEAIGRLRTALVACNPVPGVSVSHAVPQAGCNGMVLSISNPATASLTQITSLEGQEASLKTQLSAETDQLSQMQATVNSECNGTSGKGLTGVLGNGPACKKDQEYVSSGCIFLEGMMFR